MTTVTIKWYHIFVSDSETLGGFIEVVPRPLNFLLITIVTSMEQCWPNDACAWYFCLGPSISSPSQRL